MSSSPRDKGRLPEEVDVLRARLDGVENMAQRSLWAHAMSILLFALLAALILKSGLLSSINL